MLRETLRKNFEFYIIDPMLEPEFKDYIQESVNKDGLDYTFRFDDAVGDIEDAKLQKLRSNYVDAVRALMRYCKLEDDE